MFSWFFLTVNQSPDFYWNVQIFLHQSPDCWCFEVERSTNLHSSIEFLSSTFSQCFPLPNSELKYPRHNGIYGNHTEQQIPRVMFNFIFQASLISVFDLNLRSLSKRDKEIIKRDSQLCGKINPAWAPTSTWLQYHKKSYTFVLLLPTEFTSSPRKAYQFYLEKYYL